MRRYTYTLNAGLYQELGYSLQDLCQIVLDVRAAYHDVAVELCWRGPVANKWLDREGEGNTDLLAEVQQYIEEWQKRSDMHGVTE